MGEPLIALQEIDTQFGKFQEDIFTGQTAEEVYAKWLVDFCKLVDGEHVKLTPPELHEKNSTVSSPTPAEVQNDQILNLQKLCIGLQKQIILK